LKDFSYFQTLFFTVGCKPVGFKTIQEYLKSIGHSEDKYKILTDDLAIVYPKLIDGTFYDTAFISYLRKDGEIVSLGDYSEKNGFASFLYYYETHVLTLPDFTLNNSENGICNGRVKFDPIAHKGRKKYDNREYKKPFIELYNLIINGKIS
jgi:hypothetical protein